jgi:hypothetical protein
MASQECERCGAPLELGPIGSITSCTYCGVQARLVGAAPPPAPAPAPSRRATTDGEPSATSRPSKLLIVSGLVAIALIALAARGLVRRSAAPKDTRASTPSVTSLKTLGDSETQMEGLDTASMQGGLADFDALANTTWAFALARTWSSDARLTSLELHGLTEEGVLDASAGGKGYAAYVFASQARNAAAREMQRVSTKLVWSAIELRVQAGRVNATVSHNSYDDLPPTAVSFGCKPREIIALWRERGGLPRRDHYNILLREVFGSRDLLWRSLDWGLRDVTTSCVMK